MMYKLSGVPYDIFKELHDKFLPETIIISSIYDKESKLYEITLSVKSDVTLMINRGNILIKKRGKTYQLFDTDYVSFTIIWKENTSMKQYYQVYNPLTSTSTYWTGDSTKANFLLTSNNFIIPLGSKKPKKVSRETLHQFWKEKQQKWLKQH